MNTIDFTRTIGDRGIGELYDKLETAGKKAAGSITTWDLLVCEAMGVEIIPFTDEHGQTTYDEINLKLTGDDLVYGEITLSRDAGAKEWIIEYTAGRHSYTFADMKTALRDLEWANNLALWLNGGPWQEMRIAA